MKQSDQLAEVEVIKRILQGEKPLYEIIVRRLNPYLYRVGRSYNYNHEDTQDLMQDTYVDAFRNLTEFNYRSSFKTWIMRIMLNNCYRKKQKLSYRMELVNATANENVTPMFSHSNNDVHEQILTHELGNILENALAKLPENYRLVFSVREINGLSMSETAELLDISEVNVKVRLSRAKAMLRNEIERIYSPAELFEFNLIYCDAMVEKVMSRVKNI